MEVPYGELNKKLEVECPHCGVILVIDINGRVVETRMPKKPVLPWDDAMVPDEGF